MAGTVSLRMRGIGDTVGEVRGQAASVVESQ